MPANVDRRIIQMQFENKQFEKNIAKSTKSVEDLKQAMDFEETSKGLKKFADSTKNLTLAGFEKLSDNIQKLTDKFTGLGTLSELVLSQIRRGIESVARDISNFITSMTTVQVSAGMEKYNTLNKSVQTIKAATGESEATVYEVLKRLSDYTDQTSYNFADMAQNIGKFTSVGISLESAERQMEGIANWAARSGAGINEASRAMYNLSQAMGAGKLQKIDWKSIENAGMATKEFKEQLIQSGVALGTLVEKNGKVFTKKGNAEVSYKNLADTLAKGWATSQVLSSTLEKYYYDDLFYKNENAGALIELSDTQKAAFDKMIASNNNISAVEWKSLESLGVITADTREKLAELAVTQGKLTKEVKTDGTVIYKTVNKTGKQVEFTLDQIETSLGSGWFDKGVADTATSINTLAKESYEAAQKCLTFTDVLGAWKDQISSGWMRSFTIIFGELSDAMNFFSDVCNRVGDGLNEIIGFRNRILEGWSKQKGRQSLIDLIVGNYGDNASEDAYGFLDMLEGAGKIIKDGLRDFIFLFMDPVAQNIAKDDPIYMEEWLGYKLKELTENIGNFMKRIRTFFSEEVTINGKTTNRLEVIHNIVSGIAGAIKIAYDIVTKAIDFIGKLGSDLSPGLDSLLGVFGDLGTSIFNTSDKMGKENKIQAFFNGIREDVKPVTDSLNEFIGTISELLRIILGLDKEEAEHTSTLHSIGEFIRNIARTISSVAGPVIKFFSDLFSIISDLVTGKLSFDNFSAIGEKVKTAFKTMVSGLPEPIQKVVSYVKSVYEGIKALFKKGFTSENLKNVGELLKKPFVKAFDLLPDTIKNKFNEIVDKIKTLFKNFWDKVVGLWDKVSGKGQASDGKNIFQKFVGLFGGDKEGANIFDTIRDWINGKFESLLTFIQRSVGNMGGTANSFGQKVSELIEKLKKINLSKVLLWLMGGLGLAAIVLTITKIYKTFKMLAKGIAAIGDAIKNGISLKLKDSDKKIESFGDKMLKIAGAIAILTACIVVIGNMDANEALRGIMYVISLMAALVIMSYALKKVYGDMDWKSGIAIFLGLIGTAIAISALAGALVKIGQMNFGQFVQSILGLAAVIFALSVVGELSKDGQFKFANLSGMIAMALSIAILIAALSLIKNATIKQLITMGGTLIGLLTILYVFMKKVSQNDVSMAGSGMTQMIALAGAIAILILSLNIIKNSKPEQLLTMAGALIGILGILWVFMKITSRMSMEGSGLVQLIALAGSIAILVIAMIPLALLPIGRLAQAVGAVVLIIAALFGFIALTKSMTLSGTALAQFIALAGAIVILTIAMIPLALLPLGKLAQAVVAVIFIIMTLAGFMILINKFDGGSLSGKGMLGFVAVAASIAVLVYALMPLAALSPEQLLHFIGGMLAVMLGISLIIQTIKGLSLKNAVSGLLVLLSLTVLILAFAAVLHDLKDLDWKVIAAFSVGLAALVTAFAVSAAIASVVGIKGFAILAAGLAILMAVIALLAPLLIGSIVGAIRDASASLVLISDMMSRFSDNMSGVDEGSMDRAERIFDKVVSIVSKLAGMIFQQFNTYAFMYAMSCLTLAADEIIKFDDRMKLVSEDGGSGKAIRIITAYKEMFENDLAEFEKYMNDADSFYSVMFKLGSAFDYFDGATKNVVDADSNSGLKLIKQLAACAPDLDTIYKMDLDTFKNQLSELGGAMIIYAKGAEEVGGDVTDDVDVSGAVTLLRKISESLSENGGFTIPENMPTDHQLTEFGTQLAALAGALVAFEEAGSTLGTGTDKALETLTFFESLKEQLALMPGFGSSVASAIDAFKDDSGNFIKKDELSTFAEDIAQLGSAMAHFASSTQVVDEETEEMKPIDFTLATTALESIAGISNKLPELGGVKEAIMGRHQTLGELAPELNLLGDAIGEFHKSTTTFDEVNNTATPMDFGTETTGTLGFLNSIADIQNKLPTVKSFSIQSLFEDKKMSFGDLSSQLVLLGSGLHELSNSITGETDGNKNFNADAISEATTLLTETIIPLMTTLSTELPHVGGLGNLIQNAFVVGREFNLTDFSGQLGSLGEGLGTLGEKLNTGNWSNNEGVKNAFDAMTSVFELMIKVQEFYMRMDEAKKVLGNWSSASAFVGLTEFVQYLADPNADLVTSISDFIHNIDIGISDWATGTDDSLDNVLKRIEIFKEFAEGLAALISTVDTDRESYTSWSYIGTKLTSEIAKSITDGTSSVLTAITDLMTSAHTAGANVPDIDWTELGTNIALGVETGVKTAGPDHVTPAVEQMMRDAYAAGKKAIESNSPSKLFMQLGSFMGEGTAIGIKNTNSEVGSAASEMGEVALDSATNIIGLISRIMAEGADTTPTIAPILDMTNIDSGMAAFRESLGGYGINLDTSYSAGRAARIGTNSYEDPNASKPDYSEITNQMAMLGNKIEQMGKEIRSMKLVLDTGAVAGGVADILDEEYGRREFYASREN